MKDNNILLCVTNVLIQTVQDTAVVPLTSKNASMEQKQSNLDGIATELLPSVSSMVIFLSEG